MNVPVFVKKFFDFFGLKFLLNLIGYLCVFGVPAACFFVFWCFTFSVVLTFFDFFFVKDFFLRAFLALRDFCLVMDFLIFWVFGFLRSLDLDLEGFVFCLLGLIVKGFFDFLFFVKEIWKFVKKDDAVFGVGLDEVRLGFDFERRRVGL